MKSILRYPGSKWNLSKRIVNLLPEHKTYLEPYFGSGAVLFNKPASPIETINDLNGDIVNLFQVIQSEPEWLWLIPYSRSVYDSAWKAKPTDEVDQAVNFVIRSTMSHGFRVFEKSGWKRDVSGREAAYAVRHWNSLPEIIQDMALRLKGVQIEKRPALRLIAEFSRPEAVIYLDPPYVLSTRTREQYSHEMTNSDHLELLELLNQSKANILLSGYDSKLYNQQLSNWNRLEFSATAEKGLHRTEVLWTNFQPAQQLELFGGIS